ncbi:MAG: hypothetical protein U0165_18095 [Polyangiaceae bacterium]
MLTSDGMGPVLSLKATRVVREASRLRWDFHPRGMDNIDLFARYGEGIVPWLYGDFQEGHLAGTPVVVCAA